MSRPNYHSASPKLQLVVLLFFLAGAMGCRADMICRNHRIADGTKATADATQHLAAYDAKRDFSQYRAALSRWQASDVDGCALLLEQLLDRNPSHEDARRLAEQCACAASGRSPANPDRAVRLVAAETPVASVPADSSNPFTAAVRDFHRYNPTAAVDRLDRVLSENPHDPYVFHRAAVAALKGNAPEIALEVASDGLNRFPDHLRLTQALALAQYRLELLESAQVTLRQALFLDSADPLSYLLMGQTLAAMGDYDAATWHHDRAAALDRRYAQRR